MMYIPELAIAEARRYIGVKWAHRGRSMYGVDCIGLIVAAIRAGGAEFSDRTDYSRTPWKNGLEREIRLRLGEPLSFSDAIAGDIALIQWDGRREPSHVGIIGDGRNGMTLIHSSNTTSVCEHDIDDLWRSRIVMVFRP